MIDYNGVAEKEGFEPSVRCNPYTGLANLAYMAVKMTKTATKAMEQLTSWDRISAQDAPVNPVSTVSKVAHPDDGRRLFVYVIRGGQCRKVGYAADLKARLQQLQCGNPSKLTVAWSVAVPAAYARSIEAEAHVEMFDKRTSADNEWFRVNSTVATDAIKAALRSVVPDFAATLGVAPLACAYIYLTDIWRSAMARGIAPTVADAYTGVKLTQPPEYYAEAS